MGSSLAAFFIYSCRRRRGCGYCRVAPVSCQASTISRLARPGRFLRSPPAVILPASRANHGVEVVRGGRMTKLTGEERFVRLLEEHKRILYKVASAYCADAED